MLRARIIAHPQQNTASLKQSLEQSGYRVEQIRPDERPHHAADLEINLTDSSFEWTEPDLPVRQPVAASEPTAKTREPEVAREFVLAPLFREARETWALFRERTAERRQKADKVFTDLRERARGGAAILGEGASVVGELTGNMLKSWKLRLDAAAKSASDRAEAWKLEMERRREIARRARAERELFAVPPPKPEPKTVSRPIVQGPGMDAKPAFPKKVAPEPTKYEPVIEPLQAERVTEVVANESEQTQMLPTLEEEETRVFAAAAGRESRTVSKRDRDWRNSMTVAAALTLAFLIGWSIGTRDESRQGIAAKDADVAAEVTLQPAVVTPAPPVSKKAVAEVKPESEPKASPKRRVVSKDEEDVNVIAEDVVVRHYPKTPKYPQNTKQTASVKKISDLD